MRRRGKRLDVGACLDRILGKDGKALVGLNVKQILTKLEGSIYPCPTVTELKFFLKLLTSMVISHGREREIGVLRNFRIVNNRVVCDVELFNSDNLSPQMLDNFIAAAVKSAIKEFLSISTPTVENNITDLI